MAISALAVLIVLAIPPQYRSEAKLLVLSQRIPVNIVESTYNAEADERVQVTRTRVTARDQLLAIADKYQLFAKKRKDMTTTALVDLIRKRIAIEPYDLGLQSRRAREGEGAIGFKVGFDYEVPDTAAKVANELVTLILDADSRSQSEATGEVTKFMSREFARLQQELAKIDETLTNFKQQNKDSLPERVPFQLSSLERAETNLKEIDRELNTLRESRRLLELEDTVRKAAAQGEGGNPADPKTMQQQLEALRSELAIKSTTFSPTHPDIKLLKSQIKAMEKQIDVDDIAKVDPANVTAETTRKLDINQRISREKLEAVDRQVKLYETQKSTIVAAIDELNRILAQAPEVQNRLALTEREREGLQKQLEETSVKLSKARQGESLVNQQAAERFEVIEQPIVPQEPSWPNIPKLLALGIGLAGVAGAGTVGGLEFINRSIRSGNDIVRAINRHPMVIVPYIQTKEEGQRRMRKLIWIVFAVATLFATTLTALHLLYKPLDLLFLQVMTRLGL